MAVDPKCRICGQPSTTEVQEEYLQHNAPVSRVRSALAIESDALCFNHWRDISHLFRTRSEFGDGPEADELRALSAMCAILRVESKKAQKKGDRPWVYGERPRPSEDRSSERPIEVRAALFAETLRALIESAATTVSSSGAIARILNERGIPAREGGPWQQRQVDRVLQRLGIQLAEKRHFSYFK